MSITESLPPSEAIVVELFADIHEMLAEYERTRNQAVMDMVNLRTRKIVDIAKRAGLKHTGGALADLGRKRLDERNAERRAKIAARRRVVTAEGEKHLTLSIEEAIAFGL